MKKDPKLFIATTTGRQVPGRVRRCTGQELETHAPSGLLSITSTLLVKQGM